MSTFSCRYKLCTEQISLPSQSSQLLLLFVPSFPQAVSLLLSCHVYIRDFYVTIYNLGTTKKRKNINICLPKTDLIRLV